MLGERERDERKSTTGPAALLESWGVVKALGRHGILVAMRNAIQTTIDASGRLVLPKAIRDEVGIEPGMMLRLVVREGKIEIEPAPREVRIVQKGPLRIAMPAAEGPPLQEATVQAVRREIRAREA